MPERSLPSNEETGFPDWRAIWAGTFTFIAIWSVFGFLGTAIFATLANPASANPVTNMSVGIGLWAVILTIIAMFAAGRRTGRLATKRDAFMNGTVTFGLSISAALVIAVLVVGLATLITAGGARTAYALGAVAGLGWIGFVSLILGWVAAVGGAFSAVPRRMAEAPVDQVRRAA